MGCQQFNSAASTILKLCAAHYKGSVLRSTLDKSCDWAWGWGIRCLCRCHGLAPKLAPSPPPLPPPRLALPARLLSLEPHSTSPGMKGPTKRRVQRFEQINTTGFLWFWYFISPLLTCFGWWHPKLNSRCYRRRFILQSNILKGRSKLWFREYVSPYKSFCKILF